MIEKTMHSLKKQGMRMLFGLGVLVLGGSAFFSFTIVVLTSLPFF
jgi:hypothetical protein